MYGPGACMIGENGLDQRNWTGSGTGRFNRTGPAHLEPSNRFKASSSLKYAAALLSSTSFMLKNFEKKQPNHSLSTLNLHFL
jgi:hypothetical protein